ncbi:MAG: 5-(carboxyamino)imidazole ribonucleotide synthase [Oscillatoriales cyanobacterium SM2_2_1]|nr:5-(carboxyamino)imidazole ribonucleotide synthase [Oscillatoriales cyanobacterium SM2_2_1]
MVKSVGVIGGGQLAWMMAIAAQELKIPLTALATPKDLVAATATHMVGTIGQLAQCCDVITFENEFVDLAVLEAVQADFVPGLGTLMRLVDKLYQRHELTEILIPVPQFAAYAPSFDLTPWSLPVVLKARRHGYDGKGTAIVDQGDCLQAAWQSLGSVPCLVESWVDYEKELAVMVARNALGEVCVFPVVETEQVQQVCHRVIAPARIAPELTDKVQAIARQMVDYWDAVGVFGIEFFLLPNGRVLVNEIAPRTHNSGHYTIEGCHTSQFAQLLRVATGMPLGSSAMKVPVAVMVNLLGYETATSDYAEQRRAIAQVPQTHIYWYGKRQASRGRKLGHVTITAPTHDEALSLAQRVEKLWYPEPC